MHRYSFDREVVITQMENVNRQLGPTWMGCPQSIFLHLNRFICLVLTRLPNVQQDGGDLPCRYRRMCSCHLFKQPQPVSLEDFKPGFPQVYLRLVGEKQWHAQFNSKQSDFYPEIESGCGISPRGSVLVQNNGYSFIDASIKTWCSITQALLIEGDTVLL